MALTVSLSTQYHYQQPIPLTFKLLQSPDKRTRCGVASRRTGQNLDSDPQSMQVAYRLIPDPVYPKNCLLFLKPSFITTAHWS